MAKVSKKPSLICLATVGENRMYNNPRVTTVFFSYLPQEGGDNSASPSVKISVTAALRERIHFHIVDVLAVKIVGLLSNTERVEIYTAHLSTMYRPFSGTVGGVAHANTVSFSPFS